MPTDASRLSSRVRELLRSQPGPVGTCDLARPLDGRDGPEGASREYRYVQDDEVTIVEDATTGCVVIERHYDAHTFHGRHPVGHYGAIVERALPVLPVLAADERAALRRRPVRPGRLRWDNERRVEPEPRPARAPAAGPLLFFDLETTGLSGGAGTVAFLVGCGCFDAGGFHTRQYFLSGYEAEHELLVSLSAFAGRFGGLVSFNGRTFDVPLIETRYLFHRLESPLPSLPHFDMLHPARRLWRRRETEVPGPWASAGPSGAASCALRSLEEAILGVQRIDDVPGMEIPSRYFHYLRTGDLAPLHGVLEHNRLDLVSLAALTATAMRMAEEGADGAAAPHEALAMGGMFERAGRAEQAEACYARAAARTGHSRSTAGTSGSGAGVIRAEALRRLAVHRRRRGQYAEAVEAWQAMLDVELGPDATREARRALAIHHEHRAHDLDAARRIAEQALAEETDEAASAALRHRLARLERKLSASTRKDNRESGE
ncbi:MAG: ribonuclease H-like domain-containing protein [Acidobacteriota bacterium]